MSFWRNVAGEIHRRSLWQVLGIYLVAGWAAFQVVFTMYEAIGLPEWVPPLALVLLIIGLPIVLATAIVQDGGPGRPQARGEAAGPPTTGEPVETVDPATGRSGSAASGDPAGGGPVVSPATTSPDATSGASLRGFLTWRRSLLGGVAAFTMLAVVTAVFMFVRSRNTLVAQGVLEHQDAIVLADFASTAADGSLGDVVTEALRIDLVTSPVLRLAEPSRIDAALTRMRLEQTTEFNLDVAREVALREGVKAVLAGEIASLGGGYVLTAQLMAPADRNPLAAFRVTARDSSELIDAVDELSRQVRDKIGESLKTLNATPPLADVTTEKLAALSKYGEAETVRRRTGDQLRAIELMDEAIALDSSFAMAWRKKGIYLSNLGIRRDERVEAITRAHDLRDRLTEKERYLAIAAYASMNGDRDATIAAYRSVLEIDPDDYISLNNLAVALRGARRYEEAEPLLVRGTQAPGASRYNFTNLIDNQYRLGRSDAARATVGRAKQALPDNADVQRIDAFFAAADHRWDVVDSIARSIAERHPENGTAQALMLGTRIYAAVIHGQLSYAADLIDDLDARTVAANLLPQRQEVALAAAEISLLIRRDQERGLRALEDALRRFPLDSIPVSERPYDWIAQLYADAGRFDLAGAMVERGLRERPPDMSADPPPYSWTRAYIALRRGDAEPGLKRFRIASSYPEEGSCRACDLDLLGQAYEVAGLPDSARVVYERRLSLPWLSRLTSESDDRPYVLERAAALHEQAGDTAQAIQRYSDFVNLWENADPELQPRVEAARRRIAALRGPG